MTLEEVRQQYPQYKDVPDDVLADKLYTKFYASKLSREDFAAKVGLPVATNGAVSGLLERGNIDLTKRPTVRNQDGSISTVRSTSVNVDGRETLIPTVSDDGRIMSTEEAVRTYRKTGKHLGQFDSPEAATAYAKQLSQEQGRLYARDDLVAAPPSEGLNTFLRAAGHGATGLFRGAKQIAGIDVPGMKRREEAMEALKNDPRVGTYAKVGDVVG